MDALSALAGTIVGGVLVLLGDFLRRRDEGRREFARNLANASASLASLCNRLSGELIDARGEGVHLDEISTSRPERWEVVTRFYITPGSERIADEASAMINHYQKLLESYSTDDVVWQETERAFYRSLLQFESAARTVVGR